MVAMITGYGIVGFRDPFGIRPLIFGSKKNKDAGRDFMVASESVALVSQGFEVERDVAPGEAVFFDTHNNCHMRQCSDHASLTPCIFEHVYFSRPDSILGGRSVYETRRQIGVELAREAPADGDLVCPVPDSGTPA